MAAIDNVIRRQQHLFGLISRSVENLKKLGSSKMTRNNVQSRLDSLKSNWDKFQTNHEHARLILRRIRETAVLQG